MKIAQGLAMLELNINGFILNPTLVWDDESAILIDTGMPGQYEQIKSAMMEVGVPYEKLTSIILTHQDLDHIGSLPELIQQSPNEIEVYAHALDQPYIEGLLPLIKTDPNRMSEEEWAKLPEQMKSLYKNPPKAKIHHTLVDGQELPFFGGLSIIFTPGHTPGHISIYHKQSKTLVAGDALVIYNGILSGPVPRNTLDMEMASNSLRKLLNLEIENIICYHGGLYKLTNKKELEDILVRE
jgi:glyoxylase-like metal-dependent hydrolase (beta-lactamase superfamily II)